MNLLYLKYAVEVAACGSINKAAEKLYIDQPNLSRSIKELESSLGVTIFERSARGMRPTPDGEAFLIYAKTILNQVNTLENMFKKTALPKKRFSVSVPRAGYISAAFTGFSKHLSSENEIEIFYKETNSLRAIKNILEEEYRLGIVRYAESHDKYYKKMLDEKELSHELIAEFTYALVMSENSPLAKKEKITFADLAEHIEIAHGDPFVPSLPTEAVKKEELPDIGRRIFVFERGSQYELLSENTDTFMWVSPIPKKTLERYSLVCRTCDENKKVYRDVIIRRKDYKLTDLDTAFIAELSRIKNELF